MQSRETLESAMRRALAIARRGPAQNANPQVGCVILDPEGRIIAEGWHRGSGTAHAETDALAHIPAEWRERTGELTAVVTLEPCNHTGRTGPCSLALIDAGIGAVAFAVHDLGVMSSGGEGVLRAAGVDVESGVLVHEARALLAPWFARHAAEQQAAPARDLPRPTVTVKWAQSLDGRAAATDGSSRWITGAEARADVHVQRAKADAILVGTGTLLADNPELTARDRAGELLVPPADQPIPVILGRRQIPAEARVRQHPALAAHGLEAPLQFTGDDLAADLAELHDRGIRTLFVEGGPAIASALISAQLVDELLVYVAPALLGGDRLAIGDLGINSIAEIMRIEINSITPLGPDSRITASLSPDAATSTTATATATPASAAETSTPSNTPPSAPHTEEHH